MTDKKAVLMRLPAVRRLSTARTRLLAHWFDWRHKVDTGGVADPRNLTVVGENALHSILYVPTTPAIGRHMLRDLPVTDISSYTFIDMGSGKGRMLLFASELPFRRIIGVEFASHLDAVARKNVKSYCNSKQVCFDIQLVHMDAIKFEFPAEPSVIYFFYPFDQFIMEIVVQNLNRSLEEHPRDVFIVYYNPVLSDVVEAASNLKVYARRSYFGTPYMIYRSVFPARV